ncbi:hypothetical protein V3851_05970 [Paenibacillus sp. M1]|uniref:Uncharacterized protein n=1 Tax=Paenibacillus haidiansis TaxID=1574488 RepID=A0ABU7VNN5_9BACL
MTRHKLAILAFIFASSLVGCTNNQAYDDGTNNNTQAANSNMDNPYSWELQLVPGNPIDEAFKSDFEIASSTPEMNYLANTYLEAWKMEWDNITDVLMNQYQFAEDKEVIKTYKQSFEEYAEKVFDVEWLSYTDITVPLDERHTVGTGAISSSTLVKAYTYKRQVLLLIDRYYIDNNYTYKYKGSGAELLKLREAD